MLLELKVHNFAIIENISLSFNSGLNIMSGETGAGKSVLLKSLTLLMGEKQIQIQCAQVVKALRLKVLLIFLDALIFKITLEI